MSAHIPARRGLLVSLGAWVILLLVGGFAPRLPWQMAMAGMLAVVTLGIWAFALGVIGLLKVRSVRTGLVPAVFAIVIGGGLAASMVWENWVYYTGGRDQSTPRADVP